MDHNDRRRIPAFQAITAFAGKQSYYYVRIEQATVPVEDYTPNLAMFPDLDG